jgi:hypothetical protein
LLAVDQASSGLSSANGKLTNLGRPDQRNAIRRSDNGTHVSALQDDSANDLIAGGALAGKLSFGKKEQGRDHECDKNRDDSFDASPSPPIGFQVPHHILAAGSLTLTKLERLAFEP